MAVEDLHRLLRVPADVPVDQLRAAYEQAMRAATRAGDHQRALMLSAAFDALPSATKGQVYRNSRNSAPLAYRPALVRPAEGGYRRRSTPRRRPARGPRRRSGRWVRTLAVALGTAAIVAFGVYIAHHQGSAGGADPVVIRTGQP